MNLYSADTLYHESYEKYVGKHLEQQAHTALRMLHALVTRGFKL